MTLDPSHPDHLPISVSLITSAKSLLPLKGIDSQALRIKPFAADEMGRSIGEKEAWAGVISQVRREG